MGLYHSNIESFSGMMRTAVYFVSIHEFCIMKERVNISEIRNGVYCDSFGVIMLMSLKKCPIIGIAAEIAVFRYSLYN